MTKPTKRKLNPKEELFCQLFATDRDCFGNGVWAYIKAYSTKKKKIPYNSAKVFAHRLLTKDNLTARIRELIDIYISDEVVDRELGQVILQYNDLSAKIAAIREYNRVRGRLAPQKIKLIDENEDLTDEQISEEIERLRKSRKKSDNTKKKRSS